MNWKEIKYKYVGAWIEFISKNDFLEINEDKNSHGFGTLGWYFTDGVHKVKMWHIYELRHLYDFFDDNHIYVTVSLEVQYTREIDEDGNNPHYVPEDFYFDIHDDRLHLVGGVGFKTRTKTEEMAFDAAFRVLDYKINNE